MKFLLVESSGILGFQNPANDGNLESSEFHYKEPSTDSIWNLEAKAWNPESKTVWDNPTWGKIKNKSFQVNGYSNFA